MSVSGDDFIAIADRILVSEDSEIGWRVAAGRAYYGAFHFCADIVYTHPDTKVDGSKGSHERVYRAVADLGPKALGSKDLKQLIYMTKNLRDIRTIADYDLSTPFLKESAVQVIKGAKNIQNLRSKFRNDHKI